MLVSSAQSYSDIIKFIGISAELKAALLYAFRVSSLPKGNDQVLDHQYSRERKHQHHSHRHRQKLTIIASARGRNGGFRVRLSGYW
jgi:hypothetical protein